MTLNGIIPGLNPSNMEEFYIEKAKFGFLTLAWCNANLVFSVEENLIKSIC